MSSGRKSRGKDPRPQRSERSSPRKQFVEGRDSYEVGYRRFCRSAPDEHPSLLRVIECDDDSFYDMTTDEKLRHFGLGGYTEVIFKTADDIDFTKDPTTSKDGVVNASRQKSGGTSITGCTSVIEVHGKRRTIVFMRKATGTDDSEEIMCALKLAALFHEIGHVDDYEKGVNWKQETVNVVDAEVYAHHYACTRLLEAKQRVLLKYYLTGLDQMAESQSEYVKRGALRVMESPEYAKYKSATAGE